MFATKRLGGAFLSVVVFAATALAQSMTVAPDPLRSGNSATINYTNAAKANTTITVYVSGGIPATTQEVSIQLDSQGHGTGVWQVANWRNATFSAVGVSDVTVQID